MIKKYLGQQNSDIYTYIFFNNLNKNILSVLCLCSWGGILFILNNFDCIDKLSSLICVFEAIISCGKTVPKQQG